MPPWTWDQILLVKPAKHSYINITVPIIDEFANFMLHFMVTLFKMCCVRLVPPVTYDFTPRVTLKMLLPTAKTDTWCVGYLQEEI